MQARYGTWKSPITAPHVSAAALRLGDLLVDRDIVYWVEQRANEGGRAVLVQADQQGKISEISSKDFSVRSSVHEYGGGAASVHNGQALFFNYLDHAVYLIAKGASPRRLTPIAEKKELRFADFSIDENRKRAIAVCEDHRGTGEARNTIVSLAFDGKVSEGEILISGADFYSNPRVSPDGKRFAWLCWKHPHMPWDSTELWVGEVADDGSIVNRRLLAGGKAESVFQPEWSPEGTLFWISDQNGFWNIYSELGGKHQAIVELPYDFGRPQWVFGLCTYAFLSQEKIVCTFSKTGTWKLATISIPERKFQEISSELTEISYLRATSTEAVVIGASPALPQAVMRISLQSGTQTILRSAIELHVPENCISIPCGIEFSGSGGEESYAFFYSPCNPEYSGLSQEKPPLLIKAHGGPTHASSSALHLGIQFWTSRGFAVLDVNYGGSSGYGRKYRDRLEGAWGLVDVEDCVRAAKYVAEQGLADVNRMFISGGSAGGFTALCALTFHSLFKAGASYYGISDLEALAKETHKFEAHDHEKLIAPFPSGIEVYRERSPIHSVDKIQVPIIFFQGSEDKVVAPHQSERMYEALKSRGIPSQYLLFKGEGHGFRKAETVERALEAEFLFYLQVLGLERFSNL